MVWTEEILSKVKLMGTLGYSIERIIILLDIDNVEKFKKDFNNNESKLHKEYIKGIEFGEYQKDKTLFELSKTGDIESIKILTYNSERNKQLELRKKLFGV